MSEPLILHLGVHTDGTPEGTKLVDRDSGREVQLPGVFVELEVNKPVPVLIERLSGSSLKGIQTPGPVVSVKHQEPLPHEARLKILGQQLPVLLLPEAPASLGSLLVVVRP